MGNKTSRRQETTLGLFATHDEYEVVDYPPSPHGPLDKGLANRAENNCFLNVLIQTLTHLDAFRTAVLSAPDQAHGHPSAPARPHSPPPDAAPDPTALHPEPYVCLLCALHSMFEDYADPSLDDPVLDPLAVRLALAHIGAPTDSFAMLAQADATEALETILEWIHAAHQPVEGMAGCCLAHNVFGMELMERIECGCGASSEPFPYGAFFHRINVLSLIEAVTGAQGTSSSFSQLLAEIYANEGASRSCPGSPPCSRQPVAQIFLQKAPAVLAIALDWPDRNSPRESISLALAGVQPEIDARTVFYGLSRQTIYRLEGVVCFYGSHYVCFHKSLSLPPSSSSSSSSSTPSNRGGDGTANGGPWMYFDDEKVRKVGLSWSSVVSQCVRGKLQPTMLFYQSPTQHPLSCQGVERIPNDLAGVASAISDELLAELSGASIGFSIEELRAMQIQQLEEANKDADSDLVDVLPGVDASLVPVGEPESVEREFVFGPADLRQLPAQRMFFCLGDRWALSLHEDEASHPGYLGVSIARISGDPSLPVRMEASVSLLGCHPFQFGSSASDLVLHPGTRWRDPFFLCPVRRSEYCSHNRISLSLSLTTVFLTPQPTPGAQPTDLEPAPGSGDPE